MLETRNLAKHKRVIFKKQRNNQTKVKESMQKLV